MAYNNQIEGFEHSEYYNENGAGWNAGVGDANVIEEFFNPEVSANNAATRERNKWLEQAAYNTPAAQMERMIKAGINPNTAASGIAGANQNTSSSPVSQSQPQNPAAAAEALGQVGSLLGGIGSGAEGVANAANTLNLLGLNKYKLLYDVANGFWKSRLTQAESESAQLDLLFKPEQLRLGLQQLRANIHNIAAQSRALFSQYKLNLAEADLAMSNIDLNESQMGLNDMKKLEIQAGITKTRAEITYQQGLNSLLMNHNWYVQGGFPALLAGKYVQHIEDWSDEDIIDEIDELQKGVFYYSFNESEGKSWGAFETKIKELEADHDLQLNLTKIGVALDLQKQVIELVTRRAWGTGFSASAFPFSYSSDK